MTPTAEWLATRGVLSKRSQRRKSVSISAASSVKMRLSPTWCTSRIMFSTLMKGTSAKCEGAGALRVDDERHMQHAVRLPHPLQEFTQRRDDPALVEHAHICNLKLAGAKGVLFRCVDRTDAQQADVACRHRRRKRREGVEPGAAGNIG